MRRGAIKRTSFSPTFEAVKSASVDKNDCSIMAVAIVTGASYAEVFDRFRRFGRRTGKGTPIPISRRVVESFGYSIREWSWRELNAMIESYGRSHRFLKRITSHHPRRFPKQWAAVRGPLILISNSHMFAYRDGEIHDWSINAALRINSIWEITKNA